jgi:hypothetical protein
MAIDWIGCVQVASDRPAPSCNPCASALMRACDSSSSGVVDMSTATRCTRCSARAVNDNAVALPMSAMNSRRFNRSNFICCSSQGLPWQHTALAD